MAAWIWVLIPITAILVGAFNEWLKFKSKQTKIGTSTSELESSVAKLEHRLQSSEEDRNTLIRRVQNLETIVTSQMWDALNDETLAPAEKDLALAAARTSLALPDEDPDAEKIAQMARRLKL